MTKNRCETCGRPTLVAPFGPWHTAREAVGMSTRQVAKVAGVSAATVNRMDHGKDVKASAAAAVAKVYGVTVEGMIESAKDLAIRNATPKSRAKADAVDAYKVYLGTPASEEGKA